jgi:hypothetical protein
MILYTEKQLLVAYATHVHDLAELEISNPSISVAVPTVEQFRLLYEEKWEEYYGEKE